MKGKDRITAYLCTNRIEKNIPTEIKGKPKTPRRSRISQSPVSFFNHNNAWSGGVTFYAWFDTVFLPLLRRSTSNKFALNVKNFGSYEENVHDPRE